MNMAHKPKLMHYVEFLPVGITNLNPKFSMALTKSTQFLMDTTMVIIYYNAKITKFVDGVNFECHDPKIFWIKDDITIMRSKLKIE